MLNTTFSGWWFGTWILFFHILGIIIPTDEFIFFRGVGQPPTSFCCLNFHRFPKIQIPRLVVGVGPVRTQPGACEAWLGRRAIAGILDRMMGIFHMLPSGKHTKNYGKIHHFSWVNQLFLWQFSIAMFVYQRVGFLVRTMGIIPNLRWIWVRIVVHKLWLYHQTSIKVVRLGNDDNSASFQEKKCGFVNSYFHAWGEEYPETASYFDVNPRVPG